MGIPSYFSVIIRQYKHIVRRWQYVQPLNVKHFYLDCNSIIYDTYHNQRQTGEVFTEEWLIQGVIQQINHYINIIRPTHTLYIAFDGVAPLAKMEQQRTRRYKGADFDANNISVAEFQLSSITPGTLFMDKLMKKISFAFVGKETMLNIQTIVVSTSNEAGEGVYIVSIYS